ncbi:sulfotransferase [Salinibacter sp.]|uniref:sulfotransferase n=1 Tax=Salinibacter sp. TaxID=2065818 RepID=UPI0021E6FD40|nr:sulfotransferase [Salinibacter sp.]
MQDIAIIIGAARCGTSTLFRYLGQHEEVNTTAGKEPHYFCEGFYEENIEKGRRYEDLWEDGGDVLLEATTGYSKYPYLANVPENMREYGIEPKFIYMVRDPIERFKSHIKYMSWKRPSMDKEELLEVSMYSSMYSSQIKRFLKKYDKKEKYYVMTLEEFASDEGKYVEDILDFIGVERKKVKNMSKKNSGKKVTKMEIYARKFKIYKARKYIPNFVKRAVRSTLSLMSKKPHKEIINMATEEDINIMKKDAKKIKNYFDVNTYLWSC